jgi:hypothetical protein
MNPIIMAITKAPEEGELWEWRAFGSPADSTLQLIRAHPIRMEIRDLPAEDLYFVAPKSDQNVKLRLWQGEWVLKFKLLLSTAARGIELYTESAGWVYRFPVQKELLTHAAQLLGVKLSASSNDTPTLSQDEFIDALDSSDPPTAQVIVKKLRSQFDFPGGWVEIAEATFPNQKTCSLSIHSPQQSDVETILGQLNVNDELEVMNYVEACRRWQ